MKGGHDTHLVSGSEGHIDRTKPAEIVAQTQSPIRVIQVLILIGVVLFLVLHARWCSTPTSSKTTNPPAGTNTVVQEKIVVQKVDPAPVTYSFGADECVERDLGYKARWYPKNGCMVVHAPDGTSHDDCPGKDVPLSGYSPGHWKFCKKDPSATGVEIWQ